MPRRCRLRIAATPGLVLPPKGPLSHDGSLGKQIGKACSTSVIRSRSHPPGSSSRRSKWSPQRGGCDLSPALGAGIVPLSMLCAWSENETMSPRIGDEVSGGRCCQECEGDLHSSLHDACSTSCLPLCPAMVVARDYCGRGPRERKCLDTPPPRIEAIRSIDLAEVFVTHVLPVLLWDRLGIACCTQ